MSTPHRREPTPGPAGLGVDLSGLLNQLGVSDTTRHDTVATHLEAVMRRRGHTRYEIASLVRNRLVLACDPHTARLLTYDTGQILAELNDTLSSDDAETVKSIRVTVTRTGIPATPETSRREDHGTER